MACLAVRTEEDGLIGALAPIGLAASAPVALVIDLDPAGPDYPGESSLADLVAQGPRRDDLEPSRSGTAVLRNGGMRSGDGREVVRALIKGWPNTVLRLGPGQSTDLAPIVPVAVLLPGRLFPLPPPPAVYQQAGWREVAAPGSLVVPRPRRSTIAALLGGQIPRRSRWIRAWAPVWEGQWR